MNLQFRPDIIENKHTISVALLQCIMTIIYIGFCISQKEHRELLPHCTSVIQMISSLAEVNSGNKDCIFCDTFYDNIVDRCLHGCPHLDNEKSEPVAGILSLSLPAYDYLYMQTYLLCRMFWNEKIET